MIRPSTHARKRQGAATASPTERWRDSVRRFVSAWGYVVAVVVGVIIAGVGQYIGSRSDGFAGFLWWALSVAGLCLAAAAPVVEKLRRDRHELSFKERLIDAKVEIRVAMNDALDPLIEELGKVAKAEPTERPAAIDRLTTVALHAATQTIECDRARACFFEIKNAQPGQQSLEPRVSVGRAGRPRTTFREGTIAGDAVVKMLTRDRHLYCRDVRAEPPPGWNPTSARGYRTFISVPARAHQTVYGMLTLDAPNPGDLNEDDVTFLRVLASIIAVGVAFTEIGKT